MVEVKEKPTPTKRKPKTRGNGEGSIFQRFHQGKLVWVAQYPNGKTAKGRPKYITRYANPNTRTRAKELLAEIISDIHTDTYVDKSTETLRNITLRFINDKYKLKGIKPVSHNRDKAIHTHLCGHYIVDMEIQKIQKQDVIEFLVYLTDFSQSIIDKAYGLLNNGFKGAIIDNIIKVNPLDDKMYCAKPKSKKKTKKVRGFKITEQKQFIEAVNKHFNVLQLNQQIEYKYQMFLSMFTGMRMGEVNALDKDKDINWETNEITVRVSLTRDENEKTILGEDAKTDAGTDRVLGMDEQVVYLLKEYIDNYWVPNPHNLLFWDSRKNDVFTTSQVNHVFKRICGKYNIAGGYDKTNQHQLRHTFATRNIEAGMPAVVLQKIMGHKDLKTTLEIYCDVFEEYERTHTARTNEYIMQKGLNMFEKDNIDYSKVDKDLLQQTIKGLMDTYDNNDGELLNEIMTMLVAKGKVTIMEPVQTH